MSKASQDNDTYSDAETAARMEVALSRALVTSHKPHKPSAKRRRVEAKQAASHKLAVGTEYIE